MSSLNKDLIFLILQFLDEENKFNETMHKLEEESSLFFNMKHLEEKIQAGEWEEVERYLSAFTKFDDNRHSMKMFYELRKQKYLEALDKKDQVKAIEILVKDLKVLLNGNEGLYRQLAELLELDNFREKMELSSYGEIQHARSIVLLEIKRLIQENPLFRDKLSFPTLSPSRLINLVTQSFNWQHKLCQDPQPHPHMKTLFVDHICGLENIAHPLSFQSEAACPSNALPGCNGNPPLASLAGQSNGSGHVTNQARNGGQLIPEVGPAHLLSKDKEK